MPYTTNETLLYVENVTAGYDDKIIIKDINIIEKNVIRQNVDATGQVIAVLGRSGRGKSTLFKVLTGLLKPISGQILFNLACIQLNTSKCQIKHLLVNSYALAKFRR
jgi:ABC-type cobalamin/Fe3+-siderophores transport system ATPase subunit